jgi:branched-chain amino acid transport system permease protein
MLAASPLLVLTLAVAAGGLVAGGAAAAIERLAYRPLRRRGGGNRLMLLIAAIGVSFFLQDLVRLAEGLWHNEFNLNYPSRPALDFALPLVAGRTIQVKSLVVVAVSVAMMIGLNLLVKRTRLGKAMRAVAQDAATASLMGVDPDRVIARTFFLGGFLGGVAGVLFGIQYSLVTPFVGYDPGIKAFIAAVIGGIGNIPGAMLGGLVLGVIKTTSDVYLSLLTGGAMGQEYTDLIAFLVLVLLLLFRPQGLLGRVETEKV